MILLFSILAAYAGILLWLAFGFIRTKTVSGENKRLQLGLSIIICARNEEKNISLCLNSLLKQNYVLAKVQIILINDASTDNTVQRAEQILSKSGVDYKIISNAEQKGKKKSLVYAMPFVNNHLVLQRDADTFTLSPNYFQSISDHYQSNPSDLIIAPIAIANNSGLLWALQAVENNILALVAGGSAYYNKAFLCSGANLIYTKEIFEKVDAFGSNLHIPSGDDIFLLEAVKHSPENKITYLKSKDAIVYTYPVYSFSSLLKQKVRWASKFKQNKNALNFNLAVITFLANFSWITCLLLMSFPLLREGAFLFIVLKLLIDNLLLFLASGFIKNKHLLVLSLPVTCIYPAYAVIVGISSVFMKPHWK